jgi:hypothetical protein
VNTDENDESQFRLSPDERTAVFVRTSSNGSVIYESHRSDTNSPFDSPHTLTFDPASDGGLGFAVSPNITEDLLTLVYVAGHFCQPYASGDLGFELCSAHRTAASAPFGTPHVIHIAPSTNATFLGEPYVSADGLHLFADVGGVPGYGVAGATRNAMANDFGPLLPIELDLDAALPRASSPVMSEDELTVFFVRADLMPAYGNMWQSTRSSVNVKFAQAEQVIELASPLGEQPTWISGDRCRLYFSRLVDGPAGRHADVFVASRPVK